MTHERVPEDAWPAFALALSRTTSPDDLRQVLTSPLAQHAGFLDPQRAPGETRTAFERISDALDGELDASALHGKMAHALRDLLPGVAVAVLECTGRRWAVRHYEPAPGAAPARHRPDGLLAGVPALQAAEAATTPLFIDAWDAQQQQLPETADVRVAALQALRPADWPVTVLAATCSARTTWSPQERATFTGAAAAYRHALDRAARAEDLIRERATLAAALAFKERAAQAVTPPDLVDQAARVLEDTLGPITVAYLVPDGDSWRAQTVRGPLPRRLQRQLQRGVTLAEPLTRDLTAGQAQFLNRTQLTRADLPDLDAFGALALHPMLVQQHLTGLLALGSSRAPDWTPRERSVLRAVGRSLAQAVERETREHRLTRLNTELHAQARALEAFARLSTDLSTQEDRAALIRRAQEVTLSLLPAGFAAYFEPGDTTWHLRSQVGSVRDPARQLALDHGLPLSTHPLGQAWTDPTPTYEDRPVPGQPSLSPGASAAVTLHQAGQPIGVFTVGQYTPHQWTAADRALIDGVTRSLQLALDRAASLTELRRTSLDTERSNAALQVANEELESFAYSVSHDLRAPVRHIMGFTDLLRRTITDLDAQPRAARYLNIITDATRQMNAQIDAMLVLSRVTRHELHLTDVNLGALVSEELAKLAGDLTGRQVELRIHDLPTVRADPTLLRQVIANLLSNAVKYTRRQARAHIEITGDTTPDEWRVTVRDNGVGFDPTYAHKLFGVFQRLHGTEEFSGTGVGLANVRRIVQRHGGQVSADSRPEQGAAFTFTLPRPQPPRTP